MRCLLAAVAAALLATGCGAAENDPSLAAAIEKTQQAGSSRIAIDATEVDGGTSVPIACEGEADYERGHLRIACESGSSGAYELVAIGDTTYMRGDLLGIASAGDTWLKITGNERTGATFAPQRLLAMLQGASEETRRVGDEDVRGMDTVRYRLDVDCAQAELFDCAGATTPVDVWIGHDGLVRRIRIEEDSRSGTIEFHDFGADVHVAAPPANAVEDLYASGGRRRCSTAHGSPISVEMALAALRRSAFEVSDHYCMHSIAVFGATSRSDGTGVLSCLLAAEPRDGAPTTTRRSGAGGDARLELRNMTCSIVVGSAGGDATIERLGRAFADLE